MAAYATLLKGDGTVTVIEDEILDGAGVLQTDINDYLIKADTSLTQIFFADGIPSVPSTEVGVGNGEIFETYNVRYFEAYSERMFES